ncbi:unnamed protein product [Prunus armeniaca]
MPPSLPKGDAHPKGQPPAEAPNCQTLNTGDTCHHHSNLHKLAPSPIRPRRSDPVAPSLIKKTLKTKLDKAKGCWPELLPEVLWAYRTTFRTSTGETPFSLSFGTKAVVPVEIGQPTYRTSTYEAEANNEQLALNLDFIDELRDQSNMRNVAYKQRIAK